MATVIGNIRISARTDYGNSFSLAALIKCMKSKEKTGVGAAVDSMETLTWDLDPVSFCMLDMERPRHQYYQHSRLRGFHSGS